MPTLKELIAAENWARNHGQQFDAFGFQVPGFNAGGGVPGPGGGMTGANPLPGSYDPASGGIPGVTSPGDSMSNLLDSIVNDGGRLSEVVGMLTNVSSKALRDQYSPEYFTALDTMTANTNRRAEGDVTDLIYGLSQDAAERAVSSGVVGSDAYKSKLLRDLGLTRYQVERAALDDLGKIKGLTPTVDPYDVNRLLPTIKDWMDSQARADTLRAAPVPNEAFKRALELTKAGQFAGAAAGYGGGFRGAPFGGRDNQTASIPDDILKRYTPGLNPAAPAAPAAPASPGWGESWNNQGGPGAALGNVPNPQNPWNNDVPEFDLDWDMWDPVPAGGGFDEFEDDWF